MNFHSRAAEALILAKRTAVSTRVYGTPAPDASNPINTNITQSIFNNCK